MRKRLVGKQARPKHSHLASPTPDTPEQHFDGPRWPEAAEQRPLGSVGDRSSFLGHEFGRVSIHPPGVADGIVESGFQGPTQDFPFREQIEASFGRSIPAQAHTGQNATEACDALDARALTSAGHVAFATGGPSLELAAHEAAHAVQQASGMVPFEGRNQPGDRFERHADQVAHAVAAGKPAAPLLGGYSMLGSGGAAGGAVQLKRKKDDTSFVGGEEGNALMGPDDTEYIHPGQGGYAERMQGATAQFSGEFKELTDAARMKTVAPEVSKIDRAVAVATWERDWYKKQKSGFAPASTNTSWQERYDYADKKATEYTEDKQREQANFRAYNAFVPMGNTLIQQLARIEAQKMMLGIKDDSGMTSALVKGMEDAQKVGREAKLLFAQKKSDEKILVPSATASVEGAALDVRNAAGKLDAAYLEFQAVVTLEKEAEALKESGKDEEKRLKEINEMKEFVKNVGKTVDFTHNLIKSAPEKIANYVEKPSSLLPSAEKAAEVITDFIYYGEVQKITQILDTLNGMIEKKNLVKQLAHVSSVTKAYRTALMEYAGAGAALQRALFERRSQYVDLGLGLDRFAQGNASMQEEGLAPKRGGDRYATMFALIAEIREAVALARFAKTGMPTLEGGPVDPGDSKATAWAAWATGVIEHRESYASWHPHPTRVEMPYEERHAMEVVWSYLGGSDTICKETIKRFEPVDKEAGDVMAALGGMKKL